MTKRFLALLVALVCAVVLTASRGAAEQDPAADARVLIANGAWKRAVTLLESHPKTKTDAALRELLGMAYLYTSSDLDAAANFERARTTMKQNVDQGGKARFLVSLGRDKRKDVHLLDATPGELVVTTSFVEFEPKIGSPQPSQRWEKKDITECGLNPKYGKSSNSFHLTFMSGRDRREVHFRPWHFSREEADLVCSILALPPAVRR